jgi:hypothetical protein
MCNVNPFLLQVEKCAPYITSVVKHYWWLFGISKPRFLDGKGIKLLVLIFVNYWFILGLEN